MVRAASYIFMLISNGNNLCLPHNTAFQYGRILNPISLAGLSRLIFPKISQNIDQCMKKLSRDFLPRSYSARTAAVIVLATSAIDEQGW